VSHFDTADTLQGKRILVVEDDYSVASDICRHLRELGATVLGPAPTPFYAQSLLGRRGVDVAILDVLLYGTTVYSLADELARRTTPIIFATDQDQKDAPSRFQSSPWLRKPFDLGHLIALVHDAAHDRPTQPLSCPSVMPPTEVGQQSVHERLAKVITGLMRSRR
jgi:DNA-binding response OmpR family regulator